MTEDFYCDEVLSGKTPVEKVRETKNVLAFNHTRPFWETHVVVIPKKHISSLLTVEESDEYLMLEIMEVIRTVSAAEMAKTGAVRVLTNLGDYQDAKHLHIHMKSCE